MLISQTDSGRVRLLGQSFCLSGEVLRLNQLVAVHFRFELTEDLLDLLQSL
ncbi:hypothetical protein LLY42_24855 [Pseudomonas frederiksbergensis]|nr:hypothetical protein LLY42_24855 [Pseudomonas frederiksbergensis]